jgi:hypothetical protein
MEEGRAGPVMTGLGLGGKELLPGSEPAVTGKT